MKKPNTQVRGNGGIKAPASQVPNNPDNPAVLPWERLSTEQKMAQLRAEPQKCLVVLAQGHLTDPAAQPVFNEWLASVPRGSLENLAYFLMETTVVPAINRATAAAAGR